MSPHGLRALSAYHRDHPYHISVEGIEASIDYEPAESTVPLFGGNSNWRGPVWFPLNYLVITALERYHQFLGDAFTIEYPTGSGNRLTLDKVAADLQDRLISLFTRGPGGQRACFGQNDMLQNDPAWRDNLVFGEYFNGDNGAALGASHQTGWTGLIADVIRRRHGLVRSPTEIIRMVEQAARPLCRVSPRAGRLCPALGADQGVDGGRRAVVLRHGAAHPFGPQHAQAGQFGGDRLRGVEHLRVLRSADALGEVGQVVADDQQRSGRRASAAAARDSTLARSSVPTWKYATSARSKASAVGR